MKYILFALAFLVACNASEDKKPCRVAWCAECTNNPLICEDCFKYFWLTPNGLCSEHFEDSIEFLEKGHSGDYGYDKKPCRVAWCAECTLNPLVCEDCFKYFWLTPNGLCSEHYEDSIEFRSAKYP